MSIYERIISAYDRKLRPTESALTFHGESTHRVILLDLDGKSSRKRLWRGDIQALSNKSTSYELDDFQRKNSRWFICTAFLRRKIMRKSNSSLAWHKIRQFFRRGHERQNEKSSTDRRAQSESQVKRIRFFYNVKYALQRNNLQRDRGTFPSRRNNCILRIELNKLALVP